MKRKPAKKPKGKRPAVKKPSKKPVQVDRKVLRDYVEFARPKNGNYIMPMYRLVFHVTQNHPALYTYINKTAVMPLFREKLGGFKPKVIRFKRGFRELLLLDQKASDELLDHTLALLRKGQRVFVKPGAGSYTFGIFRMGFEGENLRVASDSPWVVKDLQRFLEKTNTPFRLGRQNELLVSRKGRSEKELLGKVLLRFYSEFISKEPAEHLGKDFLMGSMHFGRPDVPVDFLVEPEIRVPKFRGGSWEIRTITQKTGKGLEVNGNYVKSGTAESHFTLISAGGFTARLPTVVKEVYRQLYPKAGQQRIEALTKEFIDLTFSKSKEAARLLEKTFQDFQRRRVPDYPLGRVRFRHGHFDFMPLVNPRTGKLFPVFMDYGLSPNLNTLKKYDPKMFEKVYRNLQRMRREEFESLGLFDAVKNEEHKKLGIM